MSNEQLTWERVLDLAVYAPVGLALTVRDDLPKLARQGRQAVENRVMLARFIGEFAVRQGQRQLAKRIEAFHEAQRAPEVSHTAHIAAEPAQPEALPTVPAEPETPPDGPDSTTLPIAEYESLAASQVVQRLGSLHPDELVAIRSFELAHRARRTVLGKIAQLQGE